MSPTRTQQRPEASLTERYVHAATRTLSEDQRDDVGEELRGSIADRVDALRADGHDLPGAEHAALVELGDPDRLAAAYAGRPQHLVGPELYPAYTKVLRAVLVVAVPSATVGVALVDALLGRSFGSVVGHAVWLGLSVAVHVCFWVTLVFALADRGRAGDPAVLAPGWTPEQLPELPRAGRRMLPETCTNIAWTALVAGALVWQQVASPLTGGTPVLDPDLWSSWLPLLLVLLAAEAGLEVVGYRLGGWSPRLVAANAVLAVATAAPIAYLAATGRLLNPAAVRQVQDAWSGFDPDVAHTVVLVSAVAVALWQVVDGWRRGRDQVAP